MNTANYYYSNYYYYYYLLQSEDKKKGENFSLTPREEHCIWVRGYCAYGLPMHAHPRPCHRPPARLSPTRRARKTALAKI